MPEETVGSSDLATCDCEPCKKRKGQPHGVRSGVIHGYASQPRNGWQVRRTLAETREGSSLPTFGVELETSAPTIRPLADLPDRPFIPYLPFGASATQREAYDVALDERTAWNVRNVAHHERQRRRAMRNGDMSADEAVSMAAPRGLWHAKHDGSVSGPEFASQPATLAYWRSQTPALVGMFKALLHGGMRSHDGDTCGLHVNIGTDAFGSGNVNYRGVRIDGAESHLYRFAKLVTINPRWSTRMSQRTHNSASHWSPFAPLDNDAYRLDWARQVVRHGFASQDRYCVLNASNGGRIEFRLPRGTLRFDRFMAKLEWVAAMIEYTRNADNVVQVSAFMRWAVASDAYPALVTYMRERFNASRFGETDETGAVAASPLDETMRDYAERQAEAYRVAVEFESEPGDRLAVSA